MAHATHNGEAASVGRPYACGISGSRTEAPTAVAEDVEAGKDLTPRFSDLVTTKGIILPGTDPSDLGKDSGAVLFRDCLHHCHIGIATSSKRRRPKGHSNCCWQNLISICTFYNSNRLTEVRVIRIMGCDKIVHLGLSPIKLFGRDRPPEELVDEPHAEGV